MSGSLNLNSTIKNGLTIAHRGWHRDYLENTLAAFEAAYSLGCDMVEFDVQLSKDGVPFIFHDDDGKRLAGCDAELCAMTWNEITTLQNWIPSLEQFLHQFGHREFYLEIKIPESKKNVPEYYQTLAKKCAEMVAATQRRAQTFLASFHFETLQFLFEQKLFPNLAEIFEDYHEFEIALTQNNVPLRYYSISWEILNKYLQRERGLKNARLSVEEKEKFFSKILVWNIVGAENFKKAQALGIAGVVTDDVETLLRGA